MIRGSRTRVAAMALLLTTASCSGDGGSGPDPIAPRFYALGTVDNGSLPYLIFTDEFGGKLYIESATLVPYAVGRTVDQRLVNDRTGGGGTGGNTRDTTVARGQMMDIRLLREVTSAGAVSHRKDSTLVDVEVRDTSFIVTRPHPDPTRVRVDTGYYIDAQLIIPTLLDYRTTFISMPPRVAHLNYTVTR